jgi:hypothetical protein
VDYCTFHENGIELYENDGEHFNQNVMKNTATGNLVVPAKDLTKYLQ